MIRLIIVGHVCRKAFGRMDLDGNGFIDADELGLVLKSFGEAVPAGRLKALIREVRLLLMLLVVLLFTLPLRESIHCSFYIPALFGMPSVRANIMFC